MKTLKPHEKKNLQKKLDKIGNKEEALDFFKEKTLNEIKDYANILDTPMYNVYFKNELGIDFTKEEIIEDNIIVLFGD